MITSPFRRSCLNPCTAPAEAHHPRSVTMQDASLTNLRTNLRVTTMLMLGNVVLTAMLLGVMLGKDLACH